jgi:hypothetical protein
VTEDFGIPYLEEGVEAGIARAHRYGLEAPDYVIRQMVRLLRLVIVSWPTELDEKFLVLFVENATVAIIARSVNDPDPFSSFGEDDLLAFLAHSAAFFDSFKHR